MNTITLLWEVVFQMVVASRLTEDPTIKVLVIEAGLLDTGTNATVIHIPLLSGQGVGTEYDWQYVTTPQVGLNGQVLPYPRGFVTGGSSALNAMVYARGPSEDFDRLALVSGDDGWNWTSLQPYILKNERHVPDWTNRNVEGEYTPSVHGTGPLMTSLTPNQTTLDHLVFEAVHELGGKFVYNQDMNSGDGLGFGWMQSTVGNGARSDSSTAFLTPALNLRSNLDLLLQTQVIKVAGTTNATDLRTVEIAQHENGEMVFAGFREVILSAGSVGTPQLLLLSGIGSPDDLDQLGIEPILNLPNVGKNMQDQPMVSIQYSVNFTSPLQNVLTNATELDDTLAQWETSQTGFAAGNILNTLGFFRLDPSIPPLSNHPDPSAGPQSPHISFAFVDSFVSNPNQDVPASGNWITGSIVVQSPTINFSDTSAFAAHIIAPHPDAANLTSNEEIEEYIRFWSNTLKHPVSTARISSLNSSNGVVGPNLCVNGASGLRVVDASILPYATGGFPQAQVYIIAERASALIYAVSC
ncbi:alcohol oxidase [Gymnopus androsaceus JB14]|uniref:Alcohol oxidase n=1 Tax=Gymnopus androsaceus JB14 TaxID=1447944 RepID=A0A6A4H6F8_9AGAR|nr:alcohol oxidase [Gymnopus androsaceus JB14]